MTKPSAPPPPPSSLPHPYARLIVTLDQPGPPPQEWHTAFDRSVEWQRLMDAGLLGTREEPSEEVLAARASMEAAFRRTGR
jgi:hypothetical protein